MGYPMAQNISKFYKLKAYNRSYAKSKNLKSYDIYVCRTIEQVCENCDFLITMLPGDKEVLNISKKLLLHMKKNSTIIDMSSTKVTTAQKVYTLLKKNKINFLDAPVSGGPEGAKKASLAIMVGGDEKIYKKSKKLLRTMGNPTLVGKNGSGQIAKLCNQIIVGVTIGAVAEAIILFEKNGAKPTKLIEALRGGFADSLILKNHGLRMIKKDFKARGKNSTHLKDMLNIIELSKKCNIELPLSRIIKKMFKSLCDRNLSNYDHSSLYKEILKK